MKSSGWYAKTSFLLPFGIFLITFLVYGFTSPRTLVNIADSDELITAAYGGGIAHPPSYPLYTVFLNVILHLPSNWNPVFLAHVSSGLFQSLALVFFYLTSVALTKRKDISVIGALALAFSHLFWNQATYAEVFSLSLLFTAVLIWMIVTRTNFKWIAFIFGIAASHHQLIVFLIPGLMWIERKNRKVPWISCVLLFAMGLCLPYLWLAVANPHAALSWRVDAGVMGFVDVLLRSVYSGTPSIAISWLDRARSITTLFQSTFFSFGWIMSIVGLLGIYASRKLAPSFYHFLFISLVMSGPLLMGYMIFLDPSKISLEMHAYNTYLTLRMTLIFQYVSALYIPIGLSWVLASVEKKNIWLRVVFTSLVLGSIVFSFVQTYPQVSKRDSRFDEQFYAEVLHSLPNNAVLLVDSDDSFGLLAAQTIQNTRSDILIIPTTMQMRWGYLRQILPADIFTVDEYFRLILSLSQWAEMNGKDLFVYQPKQIFIKQLETYHYVFSPYGYALKISRIVEQSPPYSYASSSQLLTNSYSKNDLWSIFERKQLSNLHAILGSFYEKNGQVEQSKQQLLLSKQLLDSTAVVQQSHF